VLHIARVVVEPGSDSSRTKGGGVARVGPQMAHLWLYWFGVSYRSGAIRVKSVSHWHQ